MIGIQIVENVNTLVNTVKVSFFLNVEVLLSTLLKCYARVHFVGSLTIIGVIASQKVFNTESCFTVWSINSLFIYSTNKAAGEDIQYNYIGFKYLCYAILEQIKKFYHGITIDRIEKWIGLYKIIKDSLHILPPAPIQISEKGGAKVHCTVASCRIWTLLDYTSSSKHKVMAITSSIVMSRIWIMAPSSINPYCIKYIATKSILSMILKCIILWHSL